MKTNQLKELHSKSSEELRKLLEELEIDLKRIVLDAAAKRLKNVALVEGKKKDKARILTILREKELIKS